MCRSGGIEPQREKQQTHILLSASLVTVEATEDELHEWAPFRNVRRRIPWLMSLNQCIHANDALLGRQVRMRQVWTRCRATERRFSMPMSRMPGTGCVHSTYRPHGISPRGITADIRPCLPGIAERVCDLHRRNQRLQSQNRKDCC